MAENVPDQTKLMISGVPVKFPFKPYPSQLSLMNRIINGLQNRQHCLLESPTGSGKSLALLCSALAWQQDMQNKIDASFNAEHTHYDDQNQCEVTCNGCIDQEEMKESHKESVPKIWFGTRTHKQIAQITHELARTAYKSVNMSILSSREHSCIHPVNMTSKNKNDGCRDLLKGRHEELPDTHCVYYQNVHRMKTHDHLRSCGLTSAWDLEDLVKLGNRIKACPYYSTRELISMASIIFCPYNYLIDPSIRSQMSINLTDQIVILDEAHNVEDSAREAASFTVNEPELVNTLADLDHLIADCIKVDAHKGLHLLCTKVGEWMQNHLTDLSESGFEVWSRVWVGSEFLEHFEEWGITADTLPILSKSFNDAMDTSESEEENPPLLHTASQSLLGGLFQVLANLFVCGKKFAADYRITLIRSSEYGVPPPRRTRDGWVSINKRSTKHYNIKLHFWCLNPAVSFGHMECTRTVVLTSGTLSPMSSFSSELGVDFPIRLEAPHVIPDSQVWVGSVGSGPGGHQLQATYQNTNSYEFQDELGKLVGHVCEIIPNGVLCFFSSYKILEKLTERWKNTGIWGAISNKKHILAEPHGRNKRNFDEILETFYEYVSPDSDSGMTGALLLAVCRGKVSEGLDFSDNNARAVITVGIPFPNFKDKQVELKRKYNDMNSKTKGLLTGSDWYEIQAYRALNQALGRCIRHRNDWGALIIVDNRFCSNPRKYCQGLSKWVRQKVKKFSAFSMVTESLTAFCKLQQDRENGKSGETDLSYSSFFQSVSNTSTQSAIEKKQGCSEDFLPTIVKRPSTQKKAQANLSTVENTMDNYFVEKQNKTVVLNTPEKTKDVIIIPESPEIMDDIDEDDDFKSCFSGTSGKRKSLSSKISNKSSIADQLAKKCKMSIDFDKASEIQNGKNHVKQEASENCEEENSCEIVQRKTRRKQHPKKGTKNKKLVKCAVCCEKLATIRTDLKKLPNASNYILNQFPRSTEVFSAALSKTELSGVQTVNFTLDSIVLNSVWSDADKKAYMFFQCIECNVIVGFKALPMEAETNQVLFFCSDISVT
uniref:DNA 5'-3' helicase n=1 Tax=Phallusia mammillata TaxID=59560 RepID=A0A6F9D8K4_9ASCI|nr:Fanconi anemia group J protein homolog [Phallusia mammillata]